MKFLNPFKKQSIKEELTVLKIPELKDHVKQEILHLDKTDKNLVEPINACINKLIARVKHLSEAKVDEEVNKALLIGANNSRRTLCNLISSNINIQTPKTLAELKEYLSSLKKLINTAHNAFAKHGGKVSFIYKKHTNNLANALDELSLAINNCANAISNDLAKLNALNTLESLINKYCNTLKELKHLEKIFSANGSILNSLKEKNKTLTKEINAISKKAELESQEIQAINAELENIKRRADIIVSDFSKALRRFSHNTSDYKLLIENPISFILTNKQQFLELKDALLRELESGGITLKQNQLQKAIASLKSDELLKLSKEYRDLKAKLKNANSANVTEKRSLEENAENISDKVRALELKSNELKADIKRIKNILANLSEQITSLTNKILGNIKIHF